MEDDCPPLLFGGDILDNKKGWRCTMEIRVLRYFLEIAREGNMSRAAERLHVTQPTLSKQMKDLEQELGKKLFKRGSTSVSLTDERTRWWITCASL